MTDWTPAMTIGADAHIAGDGDTGFAVAEGCGNLIPGFGARDVVSSGSEYVFYSQTFFVIIDSYPGNRDGIGLTVTCNEYIFSFLPE